MPGPRRSRRPRPEQPEPCLELAQRGRCGRLGGLPPAVTPPTEPAVDEPEQRATSFHNSTAMPRSGIRIRKVESSDNAIIAKSRSGQARANAS